MFNFRGDTDNPDMVQPELADAPHPIPGASAHLRTTGALEPRQLYNCTIPEPAYGLFGPTGVNPRARLGLDFRTFFEARCAEYGSRRLLPFFASDPEPHPNHIIVSEQTGVRRNFGAAPVGKSR